MAVKSRRAAAVVDVSGVKVGGTHPIVVQSMTNTDTADSASTINQVMALARAGSELVRVTVNTEEAAAAVPESSIASTNSASRCPSSATFITTATSFSGNIRNAPGLSPSTGLTPETSTSARSTTTISAP